MKCIYFLYFICIGNSNPDKADITEQSAHPKHQPQVEEAAVPIFQNNDKEVMNDDIKYSSPSEQENKEKFVEPLFVAEDSLEVKSTEDTKPDEADEKSKNKDDELKQQNFIMVPPIVDDNKDDSSDKSDKSSEGETKVKDKTVSEDEPNNEEIPSFKEFREKKEKENGKKVEVDDLRKEKNKGKLIQKNYADNSCGAKIIIHEKEMKNTGSLLNGNKDLYVMVPCANKMWFVLELCDTIQIKALQLANYELFSSSVNEFKIFTSEVYPPKEWVEIGSFSTESNRNLQKFAIANDRLYSKFVKFEMVSHRGKEHFCVLSTFQVLGMSMVDEYEEQTQQQGTELDPYDEPLNKGKDPHDTIDDKDESSLIDGVKNVAINFVDKALNAIGVSSKENNTAVNATSNATVEEEPQANVIKIDEKGKEIKHDVVKADKRLKGEVKVEVKPEEPKRTKEPIMEGIDLRSSDSEISKEECAKDDHSKVDTIVNENIAHKGEVLEKGEGDSKDSKSVIMTNSPKKNSIFVELDKKIKELEKNLSLSNDYLETLSNRYKRVDNLFKPLEKTLSSVDFVIKNFDNRLVELEKKLAKCEVVIQLQTEVITGLKENSSTLITSTNLIIFILIIILYMFWRLSSAINDLKTVKPVKNPQPNWTQVSKDFDFTVPENDTKKRKKQKAKVGTTSNVAPKAGLLFSVKSESNLLGKENKNEHLESVQMDLMYPRTKSPPLRRRSKFR